MSIWQKIFSKLHTITIGRFEITIYDLWDDKFCWEVIDTDYMSSVPVKKRNHVLAFVALHHVQQKRKYTGEPYLFHLTAVAKMADGICDFGYEIGLCHDLLEDTDCTSRELYAALTRFGYTSTEAWHIVTRVIDLTDIYTPENSPNINRKARKELEANRLHDIHPDAQTVKYCDIINNTESIVANDPGFARVYLSEISQVLDGMIQGDHLLYKTALNGTYNALNQLRDK